MNSSAATFELRGDRGLLIIRVHDYENPTAQTASDANWLSCTIDAEVIGFSATIAVALTTQDIAGLREHLRSVLSGERASFTLEVDEQQLGLQVQMARTGQARLTGFLGLVEAATARLEFTFRTDQSLLRSALEQIERVTLRFPARTV